MASEVLIVWYLLLLDLFSPTRTTQIENLKIGRNISRFGELDDLTLALVLSKMTVCSVVDNRISLR